MKWLIENWSLLVVAVAAVISVVIYVKGFATLPTDEQIAKVKEWLLYAVVEAEKELGGGTGQIKLRYVYDMFITKFPALVNVISFDMFSKLVDEALENMKHLLDTNSKVADYVGIVERVN